MPQRETALAARADELSRRREPFVRATVVRAQHPTSARAGDTALVLAGGAIEGFVGGNCVEASVRDYGLRTLASGEPLLLRVMPGEPVRNQEEGAVTVANPCLSGGSVEIFLQPQLPAATDSGGGRQPDCAGTGRARVGAGLRAGAGGRQRGGTPAR